MESMFFDKLVEMGVMGVFCGILLVYIFKLQKEHRAERKELSNTNDKNFKTLVEVTEKNTSVVSELKGTMDAIQKSMAR
jgi:hypothetical protein